ncbi:unnamed protein product [Nippostrongylus brasiliensis]|uniref:DUF4283 domain-containing protein n=1 Tax=Nippostrongylus brasiliensis TaxID=27835 RepID=A0A0N4XMJ5_NIPBR|nr:unnamed protein product [Nippostrongylus brasiliensis]
MEHVRIIGIPMSLKKNFKVLLRELLEELEFRENDREKALTWPSMIGISWEHVRCKGKYNRRNGCAIRLIQGKGLIRKDRKNLWSIQMYDPVILVERLNIGMSKWKGLSMEKLMDPRLLEEKKAGRTILGRLYLPGLEENEVDQENLSRKRRNSEVLEDVHKKKAMISN